MCLDFEPYVHRVAPVVYDDGQTCLYGRPDSPELIDAIARAARKAVADERLLTEALADFGTEQWARCRDRQALHASIDALIAGDDAQFGILLAKLIRANAAKAAADAARDEYEEAQP